MVRIASCQSDFELGGNLDGKNLNFGGKFSILGFRYVQNSPKALQMVAILKLKRLLNRYASKSTC